MCEFEKTRKYDIINIGFVLYFILRSNEQKEGFCMSKMNEKLRKKLVRLGISVVVLAIVFAMVALVPAFQDADYEIRDNQLTVVIENKYYTNMDVVVNVIDERGNVTSETVKIYFEEGKTNYTFDQEYFKNALETEDSVYVIDVENDTLSVFSNYTTFISIILGVLMIIALVAVFNIMLFIMGLIH